jgi:hypothetical protein
VIHVDGWSDFRSTAPSSRHESRPIRSQLAQPEYQQHDKVADRNDAPTSIPNHRAARTIEIQAIAVVPRICSRGIRFFQGDRELDFQRAAKRHQDDCR